MKAFRDIRVLPVVLMAVLGLAILKVAGLAIDGSYVFDYRPEPAPAVAAKRSWAMETFNFPGPRDADPSDITGSVPAPKADAAKAETKPDPKASEPALPPGGTVVFPEQGPPVSASERAILERLQSRRQELESRAREIDIRESLLKSAEKRIEGKVEELKGVQSQISAATGQKAEAEAGRLKSIATMYEGMKPKDAARVFDRLDIGVLFEIASQIPPRKMAEILGLMSPEAAERLTVEMARRAGGGAASASSDLPKIEGRPITATRN